MLLSLSTGFGNHYFNSNVFFYYRHHNYKKTDHKNIELTEVGPRFEMKCM